MTDSIMYHAGNRELQDRFDSLVERGHGQVDGGEGLFLELAQLRVQRLPRVADGHAYPNRPVT